MSHESVPFAAVVGAASAPILGANISRRRLTISPPSIGRVTLSFVAAAVLDQGITLQAGTPPLVLGVEHVGNAIVNPVNAIADAAGRTIGGLEEFEPRA